MLQEQEKYTNDFLKTRQKILNSLVDSLYLTIKQSGHADHFIFQGWSGCLFDGTQKPSDPTEFPHAITNADFAELRTTYEIQEKHLLGAMAADLRFTDVTVESCKLTY